MSADTQDLFTDRQKKFMQGLRSSKQRDDKEVELRSQKQYDTMSRRRNITVLDQAWIKVNLVYKAHYTLADLPELVAKLTQTKTSSDSSLLKVSVSCCG
jgi:hypothetical protein